MSEPIYIGFDLSSQPDWAEGQVVLSRQALAALPEVQALIAGAFEAAAQAAIAEDRDFNNQPRKD